VTTEPNTPPMEASNEAEPDQLEIARAQGDTYAEALRAMDEESGAVTRRAGDYPYTVRVRIDPPTFMRHDPVNGKRYEQPVDLVFADRRFKPGRKPSPDAAPRGEDAPYAGS